MILGTDFRECECSENWNDMGDPANAELLWNAKDGLTWVSKVTHGKGIPKEMKSVALSSIIWCLRGSVVAR